MTAAAFVPTACSGGVLIASPNVQLCEQVLRKFEGQAAVQVTSGGAEALARLEKGGWQALFLDRRLPDLDAEELAIVIERRFPGIRVIMLDSEMSAEPAWRAREAEPARPLLVRSAPGNGLGEATARSAQSLPGMIGEADCMRSIYRLARLVAARNTTVLITGPTGTGKDLLARAIHRLSARAANSFAILNCAAIPESLLESELFGHARGAFTGAAQTYSGRILAAQGGTLFLDEIGELPLAAQCKLLRFLENKEVQRLGSAETATADVRVIAATNRNLAKSVRDGSFRDDLYFRLSAFPIRLTPLAQRRGDIPLLATHFVSRLSEGQQRLVLHPSATEKLKAHSWPGNIRELQQVLERAAIMAAGQSTILTEHVVFDFEEFPEA